MLTWKNSANASRANDGELITEITPERQAIFMESVTSERQELRQQRIEREQDLLLSSSSVQYSGQLDLLQRRDGEDAALTPSEAEPQNP